jgi:hypothetical protein
MTARIVRMYQVTAQMEEGGWKENGNIARSPNFTECLTFNEYSYIASGDTRLHLK